MKLMTLIWMVSLGGALASSAVFAADYGANALC